MEKILHYIVQYFPEGASVVAVIAVVVIFILYLREKEERTEVAFQRKDSINDVARESCHAETARNQAEFQRQLDRITDRFLDTINNSLVTIEKNNESMSRVTTAVGKLEVAIDRLNNKMSDLQTVRRSE